jgi:hypothetical protein
MSLTNIGELVCAKRQCEINIKKIERRILLFFIIITDLSQAKFLDIRKKRLRAKKSNKK